MTDRQKLAVGLAAIAIGIMTVIAASLFVHAAEAPTTDAFGNELWTLVPRGWLPATVGQLVAAGGVSLILGGATLAFVYGRPLTWARAAIGAFLFTAMALFVFAIIPNQFVSLTASLEWTPQKTLVTIPPALVLGNEMSISYSTFQQMIIGGYPVVMLVLIAGTMVVWQKRSRSVPKQKPTPISAFGRPMRDGPES